MKRTKIKYITAILLAFIVCMNAFLLSVYASTDDEKPAVNGAINEPMIINATWLDSEMLRIDVTDIVTGAVSSLAIRLGDFITDAENNPYVLIQAADLDGNLSGVIQIGNPFYVPPNDNSPNGTTENVITEPEPIIDSIPPHFGLTPNGAGTVIDNVVTQNAIEFFTVYTEEGNEFFLVVDRQSSTENVHLLNAVTEADLMALAERSGYPIENNVGAIPPVEELIPLTEATQEPQQEPEPKQSSSSNDNSNLVLIGIVVIVVGGVAYYFKIVKPKKDAVENDDDYEETDDDNSSYDEGSDYDDGGDE